MTDAALRDAEGFDRSAGSSAVGVRAVQAAYFAFVLFIPVETVMTFTALGDSGFTVSRLLGIILFGLALVNWRYCLQKIPAAFWMIAWYVAAYTASELWVPSALDDAFGEHQATMIQMAALFLISANLFEDAKFRGALLGFYGWWCSLVAAGILLGAFGGHILDFEGRGSIPGQDPNVAAGFFALGAVCLAGDPRLFDRGGAKTRWVATLPALVVLILAILATGSRGGLLAFGVGILALAACGGGAARGRRFLIAGAAMTALVALIIQEFRNGTVTAARLDQVWSAGDTAGRLKIWEAAWGMFLERPLFGYGGVNNFFTLGAQVNFPFRDTHNLLLAVLTEVGLVGALPFVAALVHALWRAWRYGRQTGDVLPFALLAAGLAINASLTGYHLKIFWIVFAAAVACGLKPGAAVGKIRALVGAPHAF